MQELPKIVHDRLKATPAAINHPDADVLTAFSERSLTEPERSTVLEHLARCRDCRDIVALALPVSEAQPAATVRHRSPWLAWPTLRWGLAAAGLVVIVSLGVVRYQSSTHPTALQTYSHPEAARTEAKNNPPAPPLRLEDNAKALANNASLPSAKPNPEESKLSSPAEAEETTAQKTEVHGLASATGGPVHHGPRSTFQQQVAGQAPPATQWLAKQQPSAPSSTPQAPSPNAPSPNMEMALRDQSLQLDADTKVDKAKPAAAPAARPATGNEVNQHQYSAVAPKPGFPGQMEGYVYDPSGAAVSNAQVTISSSAPGRTATAVTDSEGRWLIVGLPSGNYQARAEAPGFQTTFRSLNYDANKPSSYSLPLTVGSAAETVEVQSADTAVQASAAPGGNAVTSGQVQLAVNGRNTDRLTTVPRWTITAAGSLRRSYDQGKTWQDVNVLVSAIPSANFTRADAVSESEITRKKDSGASKESLKRKAAASILRGVAANGFDVWTGGSSGMLYHSRDGGDHWFEVTPASAGTLLSGEIIAVEFADPQHGKVTTSTAEVWTTNDAGQTWNKQ